MRQRPFLAGLVVFLGRQKLLLAARRLVVTHLWSDKIGFTTLSDTHSACRNRAQHGGWDLKNDHAIERRKCPVFVVGCHRSGTNLLYNNLLSAGGFAFYKGYLPIYKMLIPRFGSVEKIENRRKIMETWLRSKGFRRSSLDAKQLMQRALDSCHTGGDFIRMVMDAIATSQGAIRWAVYDPDNVLFIPRIKADIPEALFIHIIRDGRDIALSLKKMGGFRPLPWDRQSRSLLATALYWEWMVRKGRMYGSQIPGDYVEMHYEELSCP